VLDNVELALIRIKQEGLKEVGMKWFEGNQIKWDYWKFVGILLSKYLSWMVLSWVQEIIRLKALITNEDKWDKVGAIILLKLELLWRKFEVGELFKIVIVLVITKLKKLLKAGDHI